MVPVTITTRQLALTYTMSPWDRTERLFFRQILLTSLGQRDYTLPLRSIYLTYELAKCQFIFNLITGMRKVLLMKFYDDILYTKTFCRPIFMKTSLQVTSK